MKTIHIKSVPHLTQLYPTVGNYAENKLTKEFDIVVSDMGNEDYEFLVALHEMIESYLCRKSGIKDEDITAFDIAFENKREPGNVDEPGNDPQAPYYTQHQYATIIEKDLARALGVDWDEYTNIVNSL